MGKRGDEMNEEEKKNEERKDEEKNEWIEKIVLCPDCKRGRTEHWRPNGRGKHPWKFHLPCQTCKGDYQTMRYQPKFCERKDCNNLAEHKCDGVFCEGNGWVCADHWYEEEIGFSATGYACVTCWHEVGSGGH
jgi:hypothetical protein